MLHKNARILLIGYTAIAILGAFLLMLSTMHKIENFNFVDAFFMTSSAVSVTGLIVQNTGSDFTFWGQLLLLVIIQIGGFGYMSVTSFIYLILRLKIDHSNRMLLRDNLALPMAGGLLGFLKRLFLLVFIVEGIGAVLLCMRFMLEFPFLQALWLGIFHSISAFNNAGFSIFESGLLGYRSDVSINLIITTLIIIGGAGYFVLLEIYYRYKKRSFKISTHTKVVLTTTLSLLAVTFVAVFLLEYNNPKSIGSLPLWEKILSSYFTAVNYRTAGFNTLDLSLFKDSSLFFGSIFMVIGGAPGGTAGGIKVTVLAILVLYAYHTLRGSSATYVYHRRISQESISKSFVVIVVAFFYVSCCVMVLSLFESGGSRGFLALLFEVCSAFGTVGLSMGDGGILSLSANFDIVGKLIIILLMLSGKIGILGFAIALIATKKRSNITYPEAKILI